MSGGHFDYDQYKIGYMADSIEKLIEQNGRKKTKEELKDENWRDPEWNPEWYEKYPDDLCHYKYPDEVIEEFKKGVELLKLAQIYVHRIDWLISGSDGNESFLKRLKEDLNKNKL